MFIYLLRRQNPPFLPYVDVTIGLVVCASSPTKARTMAAKEACEGLVIWRDKERSTCQKVGVAVKGTKSGVILIDCKETGYHLQR